MTTPEVAPELERLGVLPAGAIRVLEATGSGNVDSDPARIRDGNARDPLDVRDALDALAAAGTPRHKMACRPVNASR